MRNLLPLHTICCGLKNGNPEHIMILLRNDARCNAVHTIGTRADMATMPGRYQDRYIPRCAVN